VIGKYATWDIDIVLLWRGHHIPVTTPIACNVLSGMRRTKPIEDPSPFCFSSCATLRRAKAHNIASPLLIPLAHAIVLSASSISGDISTVMRLMMHLHRSTFDKNYTALFLLALLEKKQTRGVAS
jgi:hypothetical protein